VPIGAQGGRVAATNGTVLLEVPAGALTDTRRIALTATSVTSLASEFDSLDVRAAYELGPSGTQFGTPVSVVVDLRALGIDESAGEPLLWLSNASGYELVANQMIVSDPAGRYELRADIDHFSSMAVVLNPHFSTRFTSDDFRNVGQGVNSSASFAAAAASTAQSRDVVWTFTSVFALQRTVQSNPLGGLAGGAQNAANPFTPVLCQEGGFGRFDLQLIIPDFTIVRNGQRSNPIRLTRRGFKPAFCHVATGGTSYTDPGSGATITVNATPKSVRRNVGQTFNVSVAVNGLRGSAFFVIYEVWPNVVSPVAVANPATTGNARSDWLTNWGVQPGGMHSSTAGFTFTGNGTAEFTYRCVNAGVTGLSYDITLHHRGGPPRYPGTVTTVVECVAAPGTGGGGSSTGGVEGGSGNDGG
jgi:hypothetical protein